MRLRIFTIVLAFGLLPADTWAQTRDTTAPWSVAQRTGSPAGGWPHDPLPQFGVPPLGGSVGVPLPQIGLPLPPIGLRPRVGPPHHRPRRFTPFPYMVIFVPESASAVGPQPVAQTPLPIVAAQGSLVLDVQPAGAQVFVDGFYVGTAADFGGERGGAFLDAGPHTVELLSSGYEPVTFDVKIVPNQAVAYRRTLTAVEKVAPAVPPAAKTPTTIYMIPGCYVGNVPPKDAGLPATCDVTRALTFVM